jgi:hypothetical protein
MKEMIDRKKEQDQVTHMGVTCNMCEATPIKGIWYKVVDKDQYDLCQHCEANNWEKDRMTLKIRSYEQNEMLKALFGEKKDESEEKKEEKDSS